MKGRWVFDNERRAFFDEHFTAIAAKMKEMDIWRNPWGVEIDGCVYNFKVVGYARRSSETWKRQQDELRQSAHGGPR